MKPDPSISGAIVKDFLGWAPRIIQDICNSWLCFEREFGTLEDFDHAVQKVTPRLEELQLFRLQQESKNIVSSTDQRENSLKKSAREKRKPVSDITDEQSPAKRQKDNAQTLKKAHGNDKAPMKNSVEANKKEDVEVHVGKPDSADDKRPNPKQYNDQCTAFISNISLQATYEDLRNFFSDVGGVVAIRLLTDKFTKKSRGLAYVDFSDDAHLVAAVAKNKQLLLGKRLSIARSDPKQSKKRGSAGHSTPMEHGHANEQIRTSSRSDSKESVEISEGSKEPRAQSADRRHGDDNVQLKGKNTFAVPRTVRPLGWISRDKPKPEVAEEGEGEKPKSNDEFRKIFLKS